jgi:hypothetical protein
MARAGALELERRAAYEPLYEIDPRTGASIEIFYADQVLAASFGARPGWFWWTCHQHCLPDDLPKGPFATSYMAYGDMALRLHVAPPVQPEPQH